MLELIRELYPLCRSITGEGLRESLRILAREIPLEIHEVPSGTAVLDWTVPPEWNIRDAWIKDRSGRRVVDFQACNLHVVSYSTPLHRWMGMEELGKHLHSLPEHPDWIPYRTSYYHESWGFCLSQRQREALVDAEYEVCIDSSLAPGQLSYGELLLPGASSEEVLISCHVCHPSLCNDNLSGIAVAVELARALTQQQRRLSYRFLFVPGTIGSITWLARNREAVTRIGHGMTLVCLGDAAGLTWKRSFQGQSPIDRAAAHVLARIPGSRTIDFHPYGYDERQYGSPGFRLPVGSLMRSRHGEFAEYHSSADDLDFVSESQLAEARDACLAILRVLEGDGRYRNLQPFGEPQLGRRGLYRATGGHREPRSLELAMLWLLQLCDGEARLVDVAERSGLDFDCVREAADLLVEHELLAELDS